MPRLRPRASACRRPRRGGNSSEASGATNGWVLRSRFMVLRKRADTAGELLNRILGRFLAVFAAASVLCAGLPANAGDGLTLSPSLNAKLDVLYKSAYDATIQRHALAQSAGPPS